MTWASVLPLSHTAVGLRWISDDIVLWNDALPYVDSHLSHILDDGFAEAVRCMKIMPADLTNQRSAGAGAMIAARREQGINYVCCPNHRGNG